jgi:exonuclease SbcC
MKIKSVKITGFRAFEKEENSTFNFTKDGEIMNFASIYAPNGFGKTSFYDAVEWGITHKIQRFDKMNDFDKVRKDNDGPLLLNKDSKNGKVIVETSEKSFENTINLRKKYNYKEDAHNEYFKDQILTQDLIDNFLKEDKAEERYAKFLKIDDDLEKKDSAYKKIIHLLKYIKEESKVLTNQREKEQKKLQGEIDFEQEFKKFDEINEVINSLNKENENLKLIDKITFNQTSYDNLYTTVEVRLSSLEDELIKAKLRIKTISLAWNGEESEDGKLKNGLIFYLENRNKIKELNDQLKELDQVIKWLEKKEKLTNESNSTDENLKNKQKRLERALKIERQFESFLNVQKEIESLNNNLAEYKDTLLKAEHDKLNAEKEKNDTLIKLNEIKTLQEDSRSKLNNIPAQQKEFELTSQIVSNAQKTLENLSKSIDTEEKKKNDLKIILDEFGYYENKINDDIEILSEFKLFEEYKELITYYILEEKKLEQFKKDVKEIQLKIDDQTQLNRELSEFVNSGLELVNKSKETDCPLCNYNYSSFEELSKNILSNKLLGNQVQIFLKEKNIKELEVKNLILGLAIHKEDIKKNIFRVKEPYSLDYKNTLNKIEKLNSEKNNNLEKLKNNQLVLNNLKLLLGNLKSFDELATKIEKDLKKIEKEGLELSNQMKEKERFFKEKEALIKSIKEKIEISEREILKYQSSNDYKEIKEYFISELNSNVFEKPILSKYVSSNQLDVVNLKVTKENLINSLNELNIKLANYTLSKDYYVKKTEELNNAKNLILRIYDKYENYVLSEFELILEDKDKSQIEKEFANLIDAQKKIEKQAEIKIKNYNTVRILNDACIKATESKKIQDQIDKINRSLKELIKGEKILNAEKNNLQSHLKKSIEAYFYTPLINSIYRKIDPHPDYKEIDFECDFSKDKPRLQIYTISLDEDGEKVKSVPSLYFSTAQINILSLSIFLARALKTKNPKTGDSVDCIFIDDPIQSMDSINILSFIDLFRGITLSLNKQLIVSTHEENFHLLLQKKIPSELFKSTFIEFETFGKLKNSINAKT